MENERVNKTRRKFLKSIGAFSGLLLTMGFFRTYQGVLFATPKPNNSEVWYGIGIDIEKCIGCGRCAAACKEENDVPKVPFFFRNWVEQYTIKTNGEVKIEAPNGGIDGFKQTVPESEIYKTFFVPKLCNHCAKSPCVQVCPVGATFDSPEGIVLVDESYCIGCRYCVQACPYGCRYIHPQKKVVDKCTMCYHRIKKGMKTACESVCPTKARIFGDLNDKQSELAKFLKEKNVYVLKAHLNTGSKLYYNALNQEVK